jgi:hypothetical protein
MATMTPSSIPPAPSRPRPVLLFAALIAGLNAFTAAGDLLNVLPPKAVTYVALISVVVAAVGGVLVQGVVTPLSSPQNSRGEDLVPESKVSSSLRSAARAGAFEGATAATGRER